MSKDGDLTTALIKLLAGIGAEAIELATLWPEAWVSKCIQFLAYSFLLYEPAEALSVFGGEQGIARLMTSERVERYFIRGYAALFRREEAESEAAFTSALKLSPIDPFVQFSLAFLYVQHRQIDKAVDMFFVMEKANRRHPLVYT